MERHKSRGALTLALFLVLLGQGASENLMDLEMCGTWIHGKSRNVWFDVDKGCGNVSVTANETTLSIQGKITGNCKNSSTIPLPQTLGAEKSSFCVFWEPLLDLLQVQIAGETHTLCKSAVLQGPCCASLSPQGNLPASGRFGIRNGSEKGDVIEESLQGSFTFFGSKEDCRKDLCSERSAELIEQAALRSGFIGQVDLPCAQLSTQRLEEGFQGRKVIMQAPQSAALKRGPPVSVWLPSSLAPREETGATIVVTHYPESTLFQTPEVRILSEVVGISLEDRAVSDLSEPVRIVFRHAAVAKNETTRCVFWDSKRDPVNITWRQEGCETHWKMDEEETETECRCDHLTYFAVLVELDPGSPVEGLEALTYITSICCAISLCSCVALIILHTRALRAVTKHERCKSSIPIHRNLAIALLLLCTLFVLTGVLANVGSEALCRGAGAALHFALLCSFSWMAIEVGKAFWLVRRPFKDFLSHGLCNLLGFGVPAALVIVFVCLDNVYGTRGIAPSDHSASVYKMCWIMDTPLGRRVHYATSLSFLAVVVLSGLGMLALVLKQLQPRREWGHKRLTFLSIWGLSLLFGCAWSLALFRFSPVSTAVLFLFCIVNALQGFFLLVRFLLLERITKWESETESQTTGSTRENMLHDPE